MANWRLAVASASHAHLRARSVTIASAFSAMTGGQNSDRHASVDLQSDKDKQPPLNAPQAAHELN